MRRMLHRTFVYLLLSAGIFVVSVAPAAADVTCTENIETLIVHSDGNIFFTTNGTCKANWCELTWGSANLLNQAYAMMLASVTAGQPVTFDWPNIIDCSVQNVAEASPTYLYVQPPAS